ncbi:MAG: ABC transporter permease [Promethearchaeota archaeon]
MKLMDKKVFREIKNNKFRSLIIIGTVAITLALIIGMRGGYPMLIASYKENLIKSNVADGRFTFTGPILESNVSKIQQDDSFLKENKIDNIEGRILIKTELTYNDKIYPAIVIGINYPNKINKLAIKEKAENIDEDSDFLDNSTNCILETKFAGDLLGQDVKLNEKLSITLNDKKIDFTVKATAQDMDFLYVVDPTTGMALMGQMAVVWVDLGVLQNKLFQGAPLINQILFTIEDRLNKNKINDAADSITDYLEKNGVIISTMSFEIYDETADRKFFDADAGSMDEMGTIFGIIGLIICCVAIYSMLTHLVQSQKRNIGLFMSLGAKRKTIIFHYLKITLLLSSIGIVIGVPLGYGMSIGMMRFAGRLYDLSYYVYPIAYEEYIYSSLATLAVCMSFSILSTLPVISITPRSAMTAFYNRIKVTKESISEKIFGWIPLFKPIHMKVTLREIFLRKKKSIITILAFSTSMIILINSLAMVSNMYSELNDYYDKYNKADIKIKLEQPVSISSINSFMANQSKDKIKHYELYISVFTELFYENKFKTWMELECYQKNSTLRNLHIISGDIGSQKDLNEDKIILGQSIAGKYDISLDDKIEIGTIDRYSIKVVGLIGELVDYSAIWTIENFYKDNISSKYFGIPVGYVNGILLDIGDDVNTDKLQEEFRDYFQIAEWMDKEQSRESMLRLMDTFMGMLVIFILIGMAIGIIFSFNTMYMGFLERIDDFLAFKAMGTKIKYIRRMLFWENALLSLFSLIITVPIGYLFYWWSMEYMMGERYYIKLEIPLYTWPIVFVLSLFAIWLATNRIIKKIKKMVLADELRQRITS